MTLQINHVRVSFGSVQAVRDVWLDAPEGAVMGVIGPNGAGKTTTMRMILNIVSPQGGSITWAGKPANEWPLGTFGYLPEERGLYPQMRGRDQVRFFAKLHGLNNKQADAEIAYWTERLELGPIMVRRVEELSKGNAQKLQFLAAVMHRPPLVILDEPFSGLDPVNVRLFKEAIKHLHDLGSTILFSSHQMDNVEEMCDRVCLIAGGRTLIHGSILEVRQATKMQVLAIEFAPQSRVGDNPLANFPSVNLLDKRNDRWRYELAPDTATDAILHHLIQLGSLHHFSVDYPSLEDIYIAKVSQFSDHSGPAIADNTKEAAGQ